LSSFGTETRIDFGFLVGVVIAAAAIVLGIGATGIAPSYFLQPTGALIVLGGTAGVMVVSTPRGALVSSLRRTLALFLSAATRRDALIEEIVHFARITRRDGLVGLETTVSGVRNNFLKLGLESAVDIGGKEELRNLLETELRLRERQSEADAKTLEVAGGFAPTIGIIGTVVGLIQVMRQVSDLQSIGAGIGMAFVSTIYGLALANIVLLPMANRIRARAAEEFEVGEMVLEGVVCIAERLHPTLIRMRLNAFLRKGKLVPRETVPEPQPATYKARVGG